MPFVEAGGFVYFEAESAVPDTNTSAWALQSELPNFSGDSYIEWTGPDFFAPEGAGQGILTYTFEINSPGNYELRWRTHIAKGESNTESNDSWVRFPTGVNIPDEQPMYGWTKVFMGHFGAWFWDAKMLDHVGANVRQFFPAGTHTMQVSGRSFGHAIDKMALFKYQELDLSPNDLDSRTGTPLAFVEANQQLVDNPAGEDSGETAATEGSVAALQIPAGIAQPPGECIDERLALAAEADVHLVSAQAFNQNTLLLAPEPARALLRFDLTGVPSGTAAELQVTVTDGGGITPLTTFLTDQSPWQEAAAELVQVPQNVLQLHAVTGQWDVGSRYAIPLPVADLPSAQMVLSLDAVDVPQSMQIASREDSFHMPILLISGANGFCDNYRAATAPDEMNEAENSGQSGSSQTTQTTGSQASTDTNAATDNSDVSTDSESSGVSGSANDTGANESASNANQPSENQTENQQANQGTGAVKVGGSGGGSLSWFGLPMLLLLRSRKRRLS